VRRLDGGGFVFAEEQGNAIPLDALSKAFARIAERAQVHGSLHTLRHSAVSMMLRAGTDAVTVAAIAGHKSTSMTLNRYAHVMSGAREEAILGLASSIAEGRRKTAQQ
jgi:integrase